MKKNIKHLEMIQRTIERLGNNSFLVKGWSMTLLAAGVLFLARGTSTPEGIILTFAIPVLGFWILDGYFLHQERLFRGLYDKVRAQQSTDFSMQTESTNRSCRWWKAIFSRTLLLFYSMEVLFVLAVFCALTDGWTQA